MNRYRKKVCLDQRKKQNVIIVDSDSEEVQSSGIIFKKIKKDENSYLQQKLNPYERIKEIPQITLTKAQMKADPIELISKLQQKYRQYGAVKIRTCAEWSPPFNFKYTEKPITTRIQKIHRLKQGKAFEQKEEHYNIKSFTDYAESYQRNYKFKFQKIGASQQAAMENQYWQIVNGIESNDPKVQEKYKATIQYAADLPAHHFGSGFPQFESPKFCDENFNYATNYWNLNNIYKSPTSVLKISEKNNEKISGVTIPWVYMGMQFSSFCWHVEDLCLNSINYSHKGATKTWYIIPESDKDKFDSYVLRKTEKRQFLNSITFMIDPIELLDHNIKVYKAYQRPREYILTLFNAYHSGFSQGYNVGEAVNIGTVQSLAIIKKAQNYSASQKKNHKPPVICFEWLISANIGNPSINQQLISEQYSKIVSCELMRLQEIAQRGEIKSIQILNQFLKYDRWSCSTCKYYQYLSVLKCVKCDKKYCLEHADRCCGQGFILVARQLDKARKKNFDLIRESMK